MKCDRKQPCISCIKREDDGPCFYERNSDIGHARRPGANARLEHLERLAQDLSQSHQSSTDLNKDASVNNESAGDESQPNPLYKGATHWNAVLDDIEELRDAICPQDDDDDATPSLKKDGKDKHDSIGILLGSGASVSIQQILTQFLPPKQETDRLVASYFRAKAVAAPFIHSAHFGRQYQSFWSSQSNASPLWISILFSILDISTRTLSIVSTAIPGADEDSTQFVTAAAHCLVLGEYHRPQRLVVEALLLFAQAHCLCSLDVSPEIGVLFGLLIRLATSMGYHTEARGFRNNSSVLGNEMRRRTWSLCMQLDTPVSFQLGLPSNVQYPTWDTKPPTNLSDADFDDGTTQLPSARPDSEQTELLFYIAKHRLIAVFEKVVRFTLSTVEEPEAELQELETQLRKTYTALPCIYRPRSMEESVIDPPSLIVARLCVFFIHQKSLCVSHRKHAVSGRPESLRVCHESAVDLVSCFLDVYKEFEAGGQLHSEQWFLGGITWHYLLLASTILCFVVCSQPNSICGFDSGKAINTEYSTQLLQQAH